MRLAAINRLRAAFELGAVRGDSRRAPGAHPIAFVITLLFRGAAPPAQDPTGAARCRLTAEPDLHRFRLPDAFAPRALGWGLRHDCQLHAIHKQERHLEPVPAPMTVSAPVPFFGM
jgi:hypothetical protein